MNIQLVLQFLSENVKSLILSFYQSFLFQCSIKFWKYKF